MRMNALLTLLLICSKVKQQMMQTPNPQNPNPTHNKNARKNAENKQFTRKIFQNPSGHHFQNASGAIFQNQGDGITKQECKIKTTK